MDFYTQSRQWMTTYEVIPTTQDAIPLSKCVKCSICNNCLAGEEAILIGNESFCWPCFKRDRAPKCVSCLKTITGDDKMLFIIYDNQVWHPNCFYCTKCKKALLGEHLIQEENRLYCWKCNSNGRTLV